MDPVLKLVVLMISLSLVQSRETIKVAKSIKLNEMMIYDCVDINKQPSLDHPLLKNHKIQMEPSFSNSKSKSQVESEVHTKTINCPNKTVPILRNINKYIANATENHLNPFSDGTHGTHFAGVRFQDRWPLHGIASLISVHDLNISKDQVSNAHIYVENRVDNRYNSIQVGWMINPTLYGDGRTWGYGFWKGANGAGCYNTKCPGFIQVSTTDPLVEPLRQLPEGKRNVALSIQQDLNTGHWWVTDSVPKKPDIYIGYWPKELFDIMGNGVHVVGVRGSVISSPSGISPPMGNGHLPTKNDMESARVHDVLIRGTGKFKKMYKYMLETILDSNKCYGVKSGKKYLFTFGGPGGDSC